MVKIIERSTVTNKENFDEVYSTVERIKETDRYILVKSYDAMLALMQVLGNGAVVPPGAHNYCHKYPFTILVSDKNDKES